MYICAQVLDIAENDNDHEDDDVVSVGSESDDCLEMVREKKDDPVVNTEKLSSKVEVLQLSYDHVIMYNECLGGLFLAAHLG